ncbi:MAG: thioredoxin family protein [Planctomycetes bacterium]|nr:thioredoxin family protein [Planctomycetota bacterium]
MHASLIRHHPRFLRTVSTPRPPYPARAPRPARLLPVAALLLALLAPLARPARAGIDEEYQGHLRQAREIYRQTANAFRAMCQFREALRCKPDGQEAWRGLGALLQLTGHSDDALLPLWRAQRLAPEDPVTDFWLGRAYHALGKDLLALHHSRLAIGRMTAREFEAQRREAQGYVDQILKASPLLEESYPRAAAEPGPATRLLLGYFAADRADANMRGAVDAVMRLTASVGVGDPVLPALLVWQAFDERGFPVAIDPEWSVSAGLALETAAAAAPGPNPSAGPAAVGAPPRITAGPAPSREERITLRDRASGTTATVPLALLGPPATLAVLTSAAETGPGGRVELEVRLADAAGSLLHVPRLAWSARRGEQDAASLLKRPESLVEPENAFEPHRNVFAVPAAADAALAGAYTVTARIAEGALAGTVALTVTPAARAGDHRRVLGGVEWDDSYERALERAAKEGKPVLADLTAPWCPWCRQLEGVTLPEPAVAAACRDFVCVFVDADSRDDLIRRFGVVDLPTLVFLTPSGGVLARVGNDLTGVKADAIVRAAAEVRGRFAAALEEERKLRAAATEHPTDAAGRLRLGDLLYARMQWTEAAEAYRKALDLDPQGATDAARVGPVRLAYVEIRLAQWAAAARDIDAWLARYAGDAEFGRMLYYRGLCHSYLKEPAAAQRLWQRVVKEFPEGEAARLARAGEGRSIRLRPGVRRGQPA